MKSGFLIILFSCLHVLSSQELISPLKKRLKTSSSDGAVLVKISEGGLNYAANIAADILTKSVSQTRLSDISGTKFVSYSVSDIKVDSFRKPSPKISMIPGHGIKVRFENSALEASGRWRWKKAFVRDSGRVRAWIDTINIELSVNIVADSNGKPSFKAHSCNADLGGFNVKLSGGASFLYNLIFRAFKGKVRNTLQQKICSSTLDSINSNGNDQLATLNLNAHVDSALTLDYHLTDSPVFSGHHFETSHKGLFIGDPVQPTIPLLGSSLTGMVGFSISEEAFNSAGRVLFEKKQLDKEFSLPALEKVVDSLDPELENSELILKVFPLTPPKIKISMNQITASVEAGAELSAKKSDNQTIPVLNITLKLNATTTVKLVKEKIVFQLLDIKPEADVKNSRVGDVTPEFLNLFLSESVKIGLPHVNEKLERGFPLLTVSKVKFPNASFKLLNGYLNMASDVEYQP